MKKKWPKPAKEFNVPLYGGRVYLYRSDKDFYKALKFLNQKDDVGCSNGKFIELKRKDKTIYILSWNVKWKSTLVHESAHLALRICERCGINPFANGGEPFCYLQAGLLDLLGIE